MSKTDALRVQDYLDHIVEAIDRTALAQLDALFASLQQRAFAGEF